MFGRGFDSRHLHSDEVIVIEHEANELLLLNSIAIVIEQ